MVYLVNFIKIVRKNIRVIFHFFLKEERNDFFWSLLTVFATVLKIGTEMTERWS